FVFSSRRRHTSWPRDWSSDVFSSDLPRTGDSSLRRRARCAGSPSTLACGTRMRIALVAEDYYPQFGGVPEHVHNLALQLNSWGHTATVVTSHMGAYPDAAFVRRVGTSRMIYSNGGVSRITTGWG